MFKISDIEKEVCNRYKIKPKRIKDNTVLKLLNLLLSNYSEIRLYDTEKDICNYSVVVDLNPYEESDDESSSHNQGYGWNIKDGILSSLLSIDLNSFLYDDIRWELMSKVEKVKHILT